MTRRVVAGRRANGDLGIFVSPPGIDAMTAADSQLTLNISSKVSQLILLGFITGSGSVALGLSRSPFVFITSEDSVQNVPGYSGLSGPIRPSPAGMAAIQLNNPLAQVNINGNGSSMSISTSSRVHYAVYNAPFT